MAPGACQYDYLYRLITARGSQRSVERIQKFVALSVGSFGPIEYEPDYRCGRIFNTDQIMIFSHFFNSTNFNRSVS
jgi:hypothetical protein